MFTYVKNLQGDVIRILDTNGNTVVSYTYDPWGVPTITGDIVLAEINPCSYRGYDYDEETGYYYLQSRYYDPEIGRFINADEVVYLGVDNSQVSLNLFSYCNNSPVAASDPSGHFVLEVLGIKITIELFALFCTCMVTLVPLVISFLRDLPTMIFYITGLIQDLVDAVTLAIQKAVKAVKKAGTARHHVIAQTAWRAEFARRIWDGYKLDIDDPRNLVRLNVIFHSFLHTKPYYEAVNALVYAGTLNGKEGVISIVMIIRTLLACANRTYF